MPKEMPKRHNTDNIARTFYESLSDTCVPEVAIKGFLRGLREGMSTDEVYEVLGKTYFLLMENKRTVKVAQYIKTKYCRGAMKSYFEDREENKVCSAEYNRKSTLSEVVTPDESVILPQEKKVLNEVISAIPENRTVNITVNVFKGNQVNKTDATIDKNFGTIISND